MTTLLSTSESWRGIDSIKFLFIFGDSFSSVGYSARSPRPSAEEPLGIAFPGETSCALLDEDTQEATYEPNWVGHLVRDVNATRSESPLLVYAYAIAGNTVGHMKNRQVKAEFLPHAGSHPEWAPWTASDALFVTWIGINDCKWVRLMGMSVQFGMKLLFDAQEELYEAGARNFCLIDVPPVFEFPEGPQSRQAKAAYHDWNTLLREGAETFSAAHQDATVLLFSSWELSARILSDPSSVGFTGDAAALQAALFVDGFHPSSALHAVLAKEILAFLRSQPASVPSSHTSS